MKKLYLIPVLLLMHLVTSAQSVLQLGTSTNNPLNLNSATTDGGPIHRRGTITATHSKYHYVYTAAELSALPANAVITKLSYNKGNTSVSLPPSTNTFEIWLKNSTSTALPAAPADFTNLISGATKVYTTNNQIIPNPVGYVDFPLIQPFVFTGQSLEITTNWAIGTPLYTTSYQWSLNTVTSGALAQIGSSPSDTLDLVRDRRPTLRIEYYVPGICSGAPAQAVATSQRSVSAPAQNFTVSLGNYVPEINQTFQWQSSPDSIVWSNITNATNYTQTVALGNQDLYFRSLVICGVDTTPSLPVKVKVIPPLSGVYTIDPSLPSNATNFNSFEEAINTLNFGTIIGNVDILFAPGTYTGGFSLVDLNLPPLVTVTFGSLSGITSDVVLLANNNLDVLGVYNSSNVIINNLTFRRTGVPATDANLLEIAYNSNNCVVQNCQFEGLSQSTSANNKLLRIQSTNNVSILANVFTDGYWGISSITGVDSLQNLFVQQNQFNNMYFGGISLAQNGRGLILDNNNFNNENYTNVINSGYAISLTNTNAFKVTRNKVSGTYGIGGILLSNFTSDPIDQNEVSNNAFAVNHLAALPRALDLLVSTSGGLDGVNVFHNSFYSAINSTSATQNGLINIRIVIGTTVAADRINILNNSFEAVSSAANGLTPANLRMYAFYADYLLDTAVVNTSNNNYFFPTANSFARSNSAVIVIDSLAQWQTTYFQDGNSFSANPLYTSTTDLRPLAGSPLIGTATPIASASTDLLGNIRSTTAPTIGAYEFLVVNENVLLSEIIRTPNPLPGGSDTIKAVIINQGAAALTSLNLSYQLDSQPVVTQAFSGSLLPQDTLVFTFNTPLLIPNAIAPTLTVYTANPNGQSDADPSNDTIRETICIPITAGTYTAGNPTSDFPDVNRMLEILECSGIAGSVEISFDFPGNIYTNRLVINQIPGVSQANQLTFNGNNDTISVATNDLQRNIILVNGTNYITIKNFSIRSTNDTYGIGIYVTNDAQYVNILNNYIDLSQTLVIPTLNANQNSAGIVVAGQGNVTTPTAYNAIIIDSNVIIGGYYGIRMNSQGTGAFENAISNNEIREFFLTGIYVSNYSNSEIYGNVISRANRVGVSTFTGIALFDNCLSTNIYGNTIHSSHTNASSKATAATGISVSNNVGLSTASNLQIFNNIVYNLNTNANSTGINANASSYVNIAFNTIDMLAPGASGGESRALSITSTADSIFVRNNNIYQRRPGAGNKYAIFITNSGVSVVSNTNNLYFGNTSGAFTGSIGGVNYATLANWQASPLALDANSIAQDPIFANAPIDFEPTNAQLNGRAVPIPGITTDFNGSPRDAQFPDIGAIEFFVPGCLVPVQASIGNIGTDSAVVSWVSSAISTNIEFGPAGFTQGTGTRINGITSPTTLQNLVVFTCYDVYLQDSCLGQTSPWDGPFSFCTLKDRDLAITRLITNPTTLCQDSSTTLEFMVRNFGVQNVTGFSINLGINGSTNITQNPTFTQTINAGDSLIVSISNLALNAGTSNVTAIMNLTNDLDSSNDTLVSALSIGNIINPVINASTTNACNGETVTLINTSNARNIGWFDPSNNQIGTGDTLVINNITQSGLYGARALGIVQDLGGPANSNFGSTQNFSNLTYGNNRLFFTVNENLTMRAVTVYPNTSGNFTLQIRDNFGVVIFTQTFLVTQLNSYDPVELVFSAPLTPGDYAFSTINGQSVGGLRFNNSGASFPYVSANGSFTITGTHSSNQGNYYHFYNIKADFGTCASPLVTQNIVVSPPTTASFTINSANMPSISVDATASTNATTYEWNMGDGTTLSGANVTHTYTSNNTFNIRLITTSPCNSDTIIQPVTITGVGTRNLSNIGSVNLFPNPSTGFVRLDFEGLSIGAHQLNVYDLSGKVVFSRALKISESTHTEQLDLNNLAAGSYLVRIVSDKGLLTTRLVLTK